MQNIKPLHTQIEKAIQTKMGTVVMESISGFPKNESNLYCVKKNGEIVWQAEKPEPTSLYNRVTLNAEGITISAYADTSHACELELETGRLISSVAFM